MIIKVKKRSLFMQIKKQCKLQVQCNDLQYYTISLKDWGRYSFCCTVIIKGFLSVKPCNTPYTASFKKKLQHKNTDKTLSQSITLSTASFVFYICCISWVCGSGRQNVVPLWILVCIQLFINAVWYPVWVTVILSIDGTGWEEPHSAKSTDRAADGVGESFD